MRQIAHLDMDAFYASMELKRNPEFKGKAMVVSSSGPRSVITTASYEARSLYGIGSAMPLSRALRLCPDLVVVPPDFAHYKEVSHRIMSILRRHVELVEVMGLDEAYLDLTGYITAAATMQRIRTEIHEATGLTCSVGRGPNKLIAKIASGFEKPNGTVTLTQVQAQTRFADESPRLLPGVGPKTGEKLAALGIRTIAALRAQSPATLQAAFGERQGAYLLRRSFFEDDGAVEPERDTKSQSVETTFDIDITDHSQLVSALIELSGTLGSRLSAKQLAGRNIAIKVRLKDWTTVTRAATVTEATNDPKVIASKAVELFETYGPEKPVRLLGVRLSSFEPAVQASLAGDPQLQLDLQVGL